jgi:hypothetical protein
LARWLAWLCILGSLLVVIAHYAVRTMDLQNREYGEGTILAMIERWREEPISRQWVEEPPYTFSNYGPAYYRVAQVTADLTGLRASLLPGRYVALLAALWIAGLAFVVVWVPVRRAEFGLAAALTFLASPVVTGWVPHVRTDTLAIALGLSGIVAAATPTRPRLALAALLVVAGSLVKPTEGLAAASILCWLAARRDWRAAVGFGVLVAAGAALAWAAVFVLTRGFFFWAVFESNVQSLAIWRGYRLAYDFLSSPVAIGALATLGWLAANGSPQLTETPYPVAFAVGLGLSVLMVCREGSNFNYFIEPAALGSVLVALEGLPRLLPRRTARGLGVLALACLMAAVPAAQDIRARRGLPARQTPETIVRTMAQFPRGVQTLADARWIDTVLACGGRPVVNDSYLYRTFVVSGRLDETALVAALHEGLVPIVLLDSSAASYRTPDPLVGAIWPPGVIDRIEADFVDVSHAPGLHLYLHRRHVPAGMRPASMEGSGR